LINKEGGRGTETTFKALQKGFRNIGNKKVHTIEHTHTYKYIYMCICIIGWHDVHYSDEKNQNNDKRQTHNERVFASPFQTAASCSLVN